MDLVYLIFRSNGISQHPGQHRGQSKIVCGTKGQGIGKICDYSKSLGQGKAEIQPRQPPKKGSVSRGALGDGVITTRTAPYHTKSSCKYRTTCLMISSKGIKSEKTHTLCIIYAQLCMLLTQSLLITCALPYRASCAISASSLKDFLSKCDKSRQQK